MQQTSTNGRIGKRCLKIRMRSAMGELLDHMLEPISFDVSGLKLDLEPHDLQADLDHGRDLEEG